MSFSKNSSRAVRALVRLGRIAGGGLAILAMIPVLWVLNAMRRDSAHVSGEVRS